MSTTERFKLSKKGTQGKNRFVELMGDRGGFSTDDWIDIIEYSGLRQERLNAAYEQLADLPEDQQKKVIDGDLEDLQLPEELYAYGRAIVRWMQR